MQSYLCYDASLAHRRGRGDKEKIAIFLLVTTRPIPHSGWCVCIQNHVGVFDMDTGQPLVISNGMGNYLRDHHKAYYTYIGMYIQEYAILYVVLNPTTSEGAQYFFHV